MIHIRREEENDRTPVFDIVRRAFGREGEAKLVDALRASTPPADFISLVAEVDGALAGHVLFSPIVIEHETRAVLVSALALAPVAVVPEAQNKGIGMALVRAGLEACRAAGHAIIVVVGHPSYYPRFGFAPARAFGLEAPFPVGDEAFMALALRPGALHGVRGLIRYPAAFPSVE